MLNRKYINEARVQRDIDPGIWASMSSMSSRMRKLGSDGSDIKVKRNDDADTLLQKYVAGLLTMKSECPQTESDIDRIGVYSPLGKAYLNAGGSMSAIQNKFVKNGGSIDFEISSEPVKDFPDYDEVQINDEPINRPVKDYPSYEEVEIDNAPEEITDKDVEQFNSGLDELDDEQVQDESPIDMYMKSMFKQVQNAQIGDYIVWDSQNGLTISDNEIGAICVCIASSYDFRDGMPRFMYMRQEPAALEVPGNGGKYEDFYFRAIKGNDDHYEVIPGNKYHYKEAVNGLMYTQYLLNIQNGPAIKTHAIANKCMNDLDPSSEQDQSIKEYLINNTYLPTLYELSKALDFLEDGKYWTSSVTDNGQVNIVYELNPNGDKFIKGDNPSDVAKVAAFVKI